MQILILSPHYECFYKTWICPCSGSALVYFQVPICPLKTLLEGRQALDAPGPQSEHLKLWDEGWFLSCSYRWGPGLTGVFRYYSNLKTEVL